MRANHLPRNRDVWRIAAPLILSNITVPLLGMVDTGVTGHLDNAAYLGAVAIGSTIFGIISSTTEPFCRACDRSRLTADGVWFLCLYAATGIDLLKLLRQGASDDELRALIAACWSVRADRGAEERKALSERGPLYQIEDLRSDPHREMHTRGG